MEEEREPRAAAPERKPERQALVLAEQAPREAREATPEEAPVPEALVVTEPGEPRVVTAAASADKAAADTVGVVPADGVVEPGQAEASAVAVVAVAVERPAPAREAPGVRPGGAGSVGSCGTCPNPTDTCTSCGVCCPRGALCICPTGGAGGA